MKELFYKIRLALSYKDFLRTHIPFLYGRLIHRAEVQGRKALSRLKRKDQIDVAFILTIPGMWKADGIFKLMQSNPHYHPYVVIAPYSCHKGFDKQQIFKTIKQTEAFIAGKGFEYVIPYDSRKTNGLI